MKEFCVDLEIAKKLKENGFPQKSYFRYEIDALGNAEIETIEFSVHNNTVEVYSAPTSDELLKELPKEINGFILEIIRYEDETIEVDYARDMWRETITEYLIESKELFYKLSNALAKSWLHLKNKGYIK